MEKRWSLKQTIPKYYEQLSLDFPNLTPAIWHLLAQRNIQDYTQAKAFFRPELSDMHSPFLMKGMEIAVNRILLAIEKKEKILVYGDYDVDGTTAVAVVYDFLKNIYNPELVNYYIPHRYREGYGVSQAGISFAKKGGYAVLITLDCGIKSASLVAQAQNGGIDVIICDHHLPDENDLPPAFAILNPKQIECLYPYKELSGCGIGFKLIQALSKKINLEESAYLKYLDWVATSIAADIVPIDGENRVLAYFGIKKINEKPSIAIQTLKKVAGVQRNLKISDLIFVLGPRINAAGRMDDAKKVIEFLIEKNVEQSFDLAQQLQIVNTERKEIDKNITDEALSILKNEDSSLIKKTTVLFQPHWHKGVVGIVASRLIDHYYRPTIILTESNGKATGSARSVRNFNVYDAIHECRDLLDNYGGHFYAAGMTMPLENVNEFQEKFEKVVSETIKPEWLIPEIEIDSELSFTEINQKFYQLITQFEPYGPQNLRPVFISKNVKDFRGYSKIVKDLHIKFVVYQNEETIIDGIGFNLASKFHLLKNNPIDIVFTLDENEYNGNVKLQIKVLDIKKSS